MDSELKSRLRGIVRQLAEQEHQRLRSAGTLVELEELACEIGDEVTRQLMSEELGERSSEVAESPSQPCPDCGQSSSSSEAYQRKLESSRGQIEYFEPAFHCPTCRRAFFPGSRLDRLVRSCYGDSEVDREDRVVGK